MAKYDITKTKKLKFARFGGLSSVNQKGYEAVAAGFHSPPATRGFYAFVWPYYEFFLLGGSWTNLPWNKGTKFSYIRDKEGNVITDKHPQYEEISNRENSNQYWSAPTKEWSKHQEKSPDYDDPEYDAKRKALDEEWERDNKDTPRWAYIKKPSPKIFEFDGELWHHFGADLKPYEVISTHGSWTKSSVDAHRRALEKYLHRSRREAMKGWLWEGHKFVPPGKSSGKYAFKDYLEVFIEKV
jgi:hypothetical protein